MPAAPREPMTPAEARRARHLERHRRYNTSTKGQRRNLAYEARHPERRLRWEPARNALRAPLGLPPEQAPPEAEDTPPELEWPEAEWPAARP